MRLLARLFVVGILIASCSEGIVDPFAPGGSCAERDTVFNLYPESLRVTMGGASEAIFEAAVLACDVVAPISTASVTWTIRDAHVAGHIPEDFGSETMHARLVVPAAPGTTFLVVACVARHVEEVAAGLGKAQMMLPDIFHHALGQETRFTAVQQCLQLGEDHVRRSF